jgi:UDP-4-amino-4-deoxy-L-arabinose-oxoglutarate aminotransferase
MRTSFLPFSKPSIGETEIAAVNEVLKSGWITTGPRTKEFENSFEAYCHSGSAVALCSATGGMHLVLKALNIGPGDEVITPSMTWASTANLIVLAGATPVFAEIDPETLMVSKETIAPLITERTKLIIPVHFAGSALDIEPIRQLAAQKNIPLVEDAAHAVGTEYKNEKIGQKGTAIFSFHPIKNITCGEGGMFCSENQELTERIRRLKFHGLGADAYDRTMPGRSARAEVLEPGFKYNMTDISAALGLEQLKRLDAFIEKRAALAEYYLELLKEIEEIQPLGLPAYSIRHSWHLFIIRINSKKPDMNRDVFMDELKKRNIGTGVHFKAIHTHKYYRETLQIPNGLLPVTEWNSDRICSIPLFPDMTMKDVEDVVKAIREVIL